MKTIKLVNRNQVIKLTHSGRRGPAGTITVGSVVTGDPGESVTITNVGTSTDAILNFVIPQGIQGDPATNIIQSVQGRTGDVVITKEDLNIENVDNTSDVNKPVSTAQQTELDKKVDKVTGKTLSTNDYTTPEKNKLAGIAAGAEVNVQSDWNASSGDAHILNKPTLGTAASTDATDYATAAQGAKADTAVQPATLTAHTSNTSNPHSVTKAQVGLGNVDNTSDSNKPISSAAQAALNAKADLVNGKVPEAQLPSFVDDVLSFNSQTNFPATGEDGKIYIAKDTNLTYRWTGSAYTEISPSLALGETSATAYRGDRGKTAYDHTLNTNNPHGVTKAQVGLSNVDNTSDADKPISTATQAALDTKAATTALNAHVNNTSNPHSVTKAQVGLGNVDNTSDADKPVSTAQQGALNGKADFPAVNSSIPVRGVSGAQSSIPYSDSTTADSIARRVSGGRLKIGTAVDTNDAVPKAQMDTADALKVNKAGDTMTGRLGNATVNLSMSNTRGGKEILYGATAVGNFGVLNNTDGIEIFNAMSDGSGIRLGTSNGLGILKGTGFPEGVITAPVGSIYIDTAITNGASSWIKKSGTGPTGWKVLEGDTGWRRLESYLNTDYFSPTVTTTQYILIRRLGSAVFLRGRFGTTASTTSTARGVFTAGGIDALAGFRENADFTPIVQLTASNGWNAPSTALMRSAIGQGSGVKTDAFEAAQFASGLNISVLTSWATLEPWPSTLPGTA